MSSDRPPIQFRASVSVPQVYALVRSGDLPAIKIGGRGIWRVDRQQLNDYLERLMDETKQWARDHPLNPRDAEPATGSSPSTKQSEEN